MKRKTTDGDEELFHCSCKSIAIILARYNITAEEMLEGLPEAREEVFAELYPELVEPQPEFQKWR